MDKIYLVINDGTEGVYTSLDEVKECIKRRCNEWCEDDSTYDKTEDEIGFLVQIWTPNTDYFLDGFDCYSYLYLACRYQTEVYEVTEDYYHEYLQC